MPESMIVGVSKLLSEAEILVLKRAKAKFSHEKLEKEHDVTRVQKST